MPLAGYGCYVAKGHFTATKHLEISPTYKSRPKQSIIKQPQSKLFLSEQPPQSPPPHRNAAHYSIETLASSSSSCVATGFPLVLVRELEAVAAAAAVPTPHWKTFYNSPSCSFLQQRQQQQQHVRRTKMYNKERDVQRWLLVVAFKSDLSDTDLQER